MNKISAKISKLTHRGNNHIKVDILNTLQSRKLVKSVTGRKFSRTHRCWYIPNTPAALAELKQYFEVEIIKDSSTADKQIVRQKQVPSPIEKPLNTALDFFIKIEPEHDFRVKVFVPWQKKDWIEKIKNLPNRAWNKKKKYWSVPKTKTVFRQLKEWLNTWLYTNHRAGYLKVQMVENIASQVCRKFLVKRKENLELILDLPFMVYAIVLLHI